MKRAALGVLLISLVAGSTAFAGTFAPPAALHNRDDGSRNDRGREQHRPDNRGDDRGSHDNRNSQGNDWSRRDDHRWDNNRRWDNDRRWNDGRHYDGRSDNHRYASPPPRYVSPPSHDNRWDNGRWHFGSYSRPYGYAPHYWRRGERLPVAYYGSPYVIGNYYDCGLRAPPYGYHWVRIDHDVVLAAVATGVVLDVIYNQFW
jgi:Ni/Co efflux regulator RcnB